MNDYLELIKQAALTKSLASEEIIFYISEGSFRITTYCKNNIVHFVMTSLNTGSGISDTHITTGIFGITFIRRDDGEGRDSIIFTNSGYVQSEKMKPDTRPGRRMGVALVQGKDTDEARGRAETCAHAVRMVPLS